MALRAARLLPPHRPSRFRRCSRYLGFSANLNYPAQYRADIFVEHKIGHAFHVCFSAIDNNKIRAMVLVRQLRRRSHGKRGSADDEAVCVPDKSQGLAVCFLRQVLPIQDDIRTNHFSAFCAAWNRLPAFKNKVRTIGSTAGYAVVAPDRSMDFLHIAAAGLLMQAVNVLRYNAVQFSLHFHGGKAAVCIVRFRFSGIQVLPIVGEERFRIL